MNLSLKLSSGVLATALLTLAGLSAAAQSTTNLRLMPIGDSITAGYLSSTNDGYRGPLWTALKSQVATQDFVGTQLDGTMSDPDNEGHYGYRIDQIASLITASLNTYKPNIITLDIGINDLGQGYEVSTAPNRLASLIDQIFTAEPEATILVAQLMVTNDSARNALVTTFNNALPGIVSTRANAGKHISLVNMSAITEADLSDGLHPNDTGYQLMANAFDSGIQSVIANGWITYPVAGSATRPVGAIYSGVAGMCIQNDNASGGSADVSACGSAATQQWNINGTNVVNNDLCLDIVGAGIANKTLVDMYHCNGTANQVWNYTNGTLVNPASGRCLDDPHNSTSNGTQLQIYDCNGGANQQWQLPAEGSITSGISGKCLDDLGGSNANSTKSVISSCNNSAEQQWKVTTNTIQFDGACLDIQGGGTANGTLVHLYACNGGTNQIWKYVNGTLVNPASGRCLDDPGSSTVNGTQLDILDCSGGTNEKWTLPAL
jgi:lysophospholipase L1-like esterase